MQRLGRFAASMIVVFRMATLAHGADVPGTVRGPDGAPFEGVFVQARNTNTRIRSASCPAEAGSTGYRTCLPVSMNCESAPWASRLSRVLGST